MLIGPNKKMFFASICDGSCLLPSDGGEGRLRGVSQFKVCAKNTYVEKIIKGRPFILCADKLISNSFSSVHFKRNDRFRFFCVIAIMTGLMI